MASQRSHHQIALALTRGQLRGASHRGAPVNSNQNLHIPTLWRCRTNRSRVASRRRACPTVGGPHRSRRSTCPRHLHSGVPPPGRERLLESLDQTVVAKDPFPKVRLLALACVRLEEKLR